jgi:hypothetical protein
VIGCEFLLGRVDLDLCDVLELRDLNELARGRWPDPSVLALLRPGRPRGESRVFTSQMGASDEYGRYYSRQYHAGPAQKP